MINFNDYNNQLLKITFVDSEEMEPIFGQVAGIGGMRPASSGFAPSSSSCMLIKFADETHAKQDDFTGSEMIGLEASDIAFIEILKPE